VLQFDQLQLFYFVSFKMRTIFKYEMMLFSEKRRERESFTNYDVERNENHNGAYADQSSDFEVFPQL